MIYSVCSAHSWVLESALQLAKERKTALLIEATSNQVHEFRNLQKRSINLKTKKIRVFVFCPVIHALKISIKRSYK